MPALCIVEDPSTGGLYTRAIAPHTGSIWEKVGYVAASPMEGLPADACNFLEAGKPLIGYTHFLLIGSPEFIARQPTPEGWVYGAYVLADSQFIPAEQLRWLDHVQRVAVPSPMTGGALTLAYGKEVSWQEVRPWGFPLQKQHVINKTEVRQLLVPEWTHAEPVVMSSAAHVDVLCAMLSRTKGVNLLLMGAPDEQHAVRMDMCGLDASRVRFTTSSLAWGAADVFVALDPFTPWPWDVVYALSQSLPTLAIKTHVYETFTDAIGCVGPIPAFDSVIAGQKLGYQANSSDIAGAFAAFVRDPANLHARARIAGEAFAAHTQELFTKQLIKTLFAA